MACSKGREHLKTTQRAAWHAARIHVLSPSGFPDPRISCPFDLMICEECGGGHGASECPHKLCEECGGGHWLSDCPSRSRDGELQINVSREALQESLIHRIRREALRAQADLAADENSIAEEIQRKRKELERRREAARKRKLEATTASLACKELEIARLKERVNLLETSTASTASVRRRRTTSPNAAPASSSSQDHPDVAASQGNIASVSAPATRALCAHSHLLGANGRNPAYAEGIASCDVCSKHVPVAEAWSCTICRTDWCKECSTEQKGWKGGTLADRISPVAESAYSSCGVDQGKAPVCKYWPNCLVPTCAYAHPAVPCKYGHGCARADCQFVHDLGPLRETELAWRLLELLIANQSARSLEPYVPFNEWEEVYSRWTVVNWPHRGRRAFLRSLFSRRAIATPPSGHHLDVFKVDASNTTRKGKVKKRTFWFVGHKPRSRPGCDAMSLALREPLLAFAPAMPCAPKGDPTTMMTETHAYSG